VPLGAALSFSLNDSMQARQGVRVEVCSWWLVFAC